MTWNKISIGDLGKVITGNTPPKKVKEFYGSAFKFIKPTDMNIGERFTFQTEEFYSHLASEKYKKSLIPPYSTCVVTIGSIGKKITLTDENCFVNQAVNAVIPKKDEFDPLFVFYALKNLLQTIKKADTGASSGRENVSRSNFMSIPLWVPKQIAHQKKIGSILSAYDDLIENNLKRIQLLEEATQHFYKEWFVNFRFPGSESKSINKETGLPEGWEKSKINEFGLVITGKTPPTKKAQYYGGDIPFIKTPDMHNSAYVINTGSSLSEEGSNTQAEKLLPPNSVLVSCIGTAGVVALNAFPSQTNQQINAVVFDSSYKSFYFYCFAIGLKKLLEGLGSNGATMVNVNKGKFENIDLNIPPEKLLRNFHSLVKSNFEQILVLLQQNKKLQEARDLLLPRLMNKTINI